MAKTKTSILVDQALWERFKREVGRRFKGRRPSVPPVSSVIEDLLRSWLEGLNKAKVPVYEVAYIVGLEPRILLKYARANPKLAFNILQARPASFLEILTIDFKPSSPEEAEKAEEEYFYKVEGDRVRIYFYDDWNKEWFEGGDTWYFIGRNQGPPYFNPWMLEVLLGEGYPEALAARYLGLTEACIGTYLTFNLYDPEGWHRLLGILRGLIRDNTAPAKTYLKDRGCDAFRLARATMGYGQETMNGLKFLELLGEWLPRNAPII